MLKLLFIFVTCSPFATYATWPYAKETFKKNAWLYEAYLDDRFPLYDLGRLHLLCLRQMISERLEDYNQVYLDEHEVYDLVHEKKYLQDELWNRYQCDLGIED